MTKKYRGMTTEHGQDGWCWHNGKQDGEYGGYWPAKEKCREDIDFAKSGARHY